jgi:hypothetical protein
MVDRPACLIGCAWIDLDVCRDTKGRIRKITVLFLGEFFKEPTLHVHSIDEVVE